MKDAKDPIKTAPAPASKTSAKPTLKSPKPKKADKNPRKKRLLVGAVILALTIALGLLALHFLPDFMTQPAFNPDANDQHKGNYRLALNYDPGSGLDSDLEKKLIAGSQNDQIGIEHLFYNKLALAIYYVKIKMSGPAFTLLDEAANLTADPIQMKQVWKYTLECEKLVGDEDAIAEVSEIYELYEDYPDDI